MIDIVDELNAIHREVARQPGADGSESVSVRLRRADEITAAAEVAMAQFGGGAMADALRRTDDGEQS